jgi:hypothetical protein
VRPIQTLDELAAYWRVMVDLFGDTQAPWPTVRGLWEVFPRGITVMPGADGIAAALELWPLRPDAFAALADGTLRDREVGPVHLERGRCATWFLSALYVAPTLRDTGALIHLVATCQAAFLEWEEVAYPLSVGAFAFSSALERILPALGFALLRPADELPDRMPFYRREAATVEEARAALGLA